MNPQKPIIAHSAIANIDSSDQKSETRPRIITTACLTQRKALAVLCCASILLLALSVLLFAADPSKSSTPKTTSTAKELGTNGAKAPQSLAELPATPANQPQVQGIRPLSDAVPQRVKTEFHLATSIDVNKLRPAPEAVVNNPGNNSSARCILAATSENGDTLVVYVPQERIVEILLSKVPASPSFYWFAPLTSKITPAVSVMTSTTVQFPTPSEGDWILVVKGSKQHATAFIGLTNQTQYRAVSPPTLSAENAISWHTNRIDAWRPATAIFPRRRIVVALVNGKAEGELKGFGENGNLCVTETYKNGQLEGERVCYYPSGKVHSRFWFRNDTAYGTSTSYYESGVVASRIDFKDGTPHGTHVQYFPNGSLAVASEVSTGVPQGRRAHYLQDGRVFGYTFWQDGQEVGRQLLIQPTQRDLEDAEKLEAFSRRLLKDYWER